jgi:HlyD family secretion protein
MQKLKLKPAVVVSLVVVAIAGAAAAFFFLSPSPTAPKGPALAAPKPALTVSTAVPQPARLPITLAANGNIAAWQEALIGSESSGLRLTEVRVNVGDSVKAGQVLATFAGDSVQADVAQARAGLMEARANALDAVANGDRARTLQNTGALSTQQINQYFTAEKAAQARVEAAQAVLDAQQLRGKKTQVLAPDSGVISARTATVGAVVGAGTELFRLIRQGRLEWRAEVTSAELDRIRAGTLATVQPPSGGALQGRVRMIAPTVDPQTRTALVYVDLPPMSKVGAALPGMFARGEFDLGASNALTVPQQALIVRDGFHFVFVLGADQRVSQVKVQTGRRVGDRVEVVSGLAPETQVVVNGAGFLNHGDLVRVVQELKPNQPLAPAPPAPEASK